MKRKIFTLGLLSLAFSANAQSLLGVQDQASLHIKEDALIYSGGEVKTVADGVIDNFGNVMIVGGGFKTVTVSNTDKTNGGNFILRLWTKPGITNGDIVNGGDVIKYGQLYIDNQTPQTQVTGIVDKEYKDNSHGVYQQMAIPFYKKTFASLSSELSASLSGNRWNRTGILVWNNRKVRFDHFNPSDNTTDIRLAGHAVENNGATSYYTIGSRFFNAFTGGTLNTLSTKVFTIKGVPFAGNITATLNGAGNGVDFGVDGKNTNYYKERYNSYLGDNWEFSSSPWTGNYGKNIYQFGNPYLTNLNLKYLGKIVSNLRGVRVEPGTAVKATGDTSGVYLSYTNGVAVGDVKRTMVRPMGTFVVKLTAGSTTPLDFGKLRKFAYSASSSATPTYNDGVTVQSKSLNEELLLSELSELSTNSTAKIANARLFNSTVKQLGVIALDADGKELGRTYYVVHADGISGQPTKLTTQVTANSKTVIGTFEESKKGGVDEDLINSYWLYINEANEDDFKGKEVPMRIYSSDVKSLAFEILENAEDIADGQERLSSGESFYIFDGKNHVLVGNNKKISVSSDANFGLYYGKPAELVSQSQKNAIAAIQKPSATILAYDESIAAHKILFDPEWKKATVQVFDLSGRLIFSQANVDATREFVLNLPNAVRGTYVVTAVSETGKKFSQKVIK
jgi:hypothetical protein